MPPLVAAGESGACARERGDRPRVRAPSARARAVLVNLSASSAGPVFDAGGLDGDGTPLITVTADDSYQLHFTRPAGLDAGAAFALP